MGIAEIFRRTVTRDKFAKIALKTLSAMLSEAGYIKTLSYSSGDFFISSDGENDTFKWHLENAYSNYTTAEARDRDSVLQRFAKSVVEGMARQFPDSLDEAKSRILPGIRENTFTEPLRLMGQINGDIQEKMVSKPFSDNFIITLIYDSDESMTTLNEKALTDWNTDFDSALEVAKDNLRGNSTDKFEVIAPGLYISPWGDDYDASRILTPELLFKLDIMGDPVVAIPTRSALLVTGSKDEDNVQQLADLTLELLQKEPTLLSGFTMTYTNDQWKPFPTNPATAAELALYNLNRQWEGHIYDEQKSSLESYLEKLNQDIFVGSVITIEDKQTGQYRTLSVWTNGVHTLLPKADYISFIEDVEGDSDSIVVEWDNAFPIIDRYLKNTDYTPTRYELTEFPSQAEFEALKRQTTDNLGQ